MSKPLILSRLHNYPSPDSPYSTVYNIPHTGALRKFDGIRLASDTLHTHTRIYIRIRCIPETFTAARDAGLRAKIYGFRRRRRRRRLREYRLSRSLPRGQSPGDGRRDEREREHRPKGFGNASTGAGNAPRACSHALYEGESDYNKDWMAILGRREGPLT